MQFLLTATAAALGVKLVAWNEHGLDNEVVPDRLEALRAQVLADARESNPVRDAVIDGYGALREQVGRSIRRFPPSSLALRGQFERRGDLAGVSPAVDIYNLISLATGLSIGAHDLAAVEGDVRLDLTRGHERFLAIGSEQEKPLPAGEYAYLDDSDRVLCRLEYRQSAHTCLTSDSRDCLFIVQGHAATGMDMLIHAADRISELLANHCGSSRGTRWQLG